MKTKDVKCSRKKYLVDQTKIKFCKNVGITLPILAIIIYGVSARLTVKNYNYYNHLTASFPGQPG